MEPFDSTGWMPMHHGLCLVGGNTSEAEENSAVGGCYNGGANIGSTSAPKYDPVPGGNRNCTRCRWFVTEPHYLKPLIAHFNNIAYYRDEACKACRVHDNTLQELKKEKGDAEEARRRNLQNVHEICRKQHGQARSPLLVSPGSPTKPHSC